MRATSPIPFATIAEGTSKAISLTSKEAKTLEKIVREAVRRDFVHRKIDTSLLLSNPALMEIRIEVLLEEQVKVYLLYHESHQEVMKF